MNGRDDDHHTSADGIVVAGPAPSDGALPSIVAPLSGRQVRLRLTLGKETLEIVGPGGATELSIVLTERGPRLILDAADIQINTVNRIAVACESFEVRARDDLSLSGAQASLVAREGDAAITANDYVRVVGEQIRLNCDAPDRVPAWMQSEIAAQLQRAARSPAAAPSAAPDGDAPPMPIKKTEEETP
jgi:hypothetical protein